MLEVLNLSHQWQRKGGGSSALNAVHFTLPGGHLAAILGAVGSGKTTLIHLLSGQDQVQSGGMLWMGEEIPKTGMAHGRTALVSAEQEELHGDLNVKEHVMSAILLRVADVSRRDAVLKADQLLVLCGLDGMGGNRARTLDKAQGRRLAMAMALASDPVLVVCDEFTSGVDPRAERELGALLQQVAKAQPGRVVVNATSSLAELSTYDSVVVLHEGRVCFHGPGRALTHYFSIPHTEDLYHRLAKRPADRWQDSWDRHCDSYYDAFKLLGGGGGAEGGLRAAEDDSGGRLTLGRRVATPAESSPTEEATKPAPAGRPGLQAQVKVLLQRRWTIFRRRKSDLWMQAGFVLGLPLVVVLLVSARNPDLARWPLRLAESPAAGSFLSMTFLMQVLLLMLAAVWTVSREAVEGRNAWPTEHVGGLRSSAWASARIIYVVVLLLAQALSMALLTEVVLGAMPGHGGWRAILLAATSLGFGLLTLGLSAWCRTVDQARVYGLTLLVINALGCGAMLAWPKATALLVQPFLTAYYGWSGAVSTLAGSEWIQGVRSLISTSFASPWLALGMLLLHALVGIGLLVSGLRIRR